MRKALWSGVMVLGVVVASPFVTHAVASFFVDDNGNVGIGNSDPQAPLDVSGAMYSRLVTATSTAIDWNKGNVQTMTLASNPTLAFSNAQSGGVYKLILNQDATGGRTVTWPASVQWAGGVPPVQTSSASGTDMLSFAYDGSRYLGRYDLDLKQPDSLLSSLAAYWKLDNNSRDSLGLNDGEGVNIAYSSGSGKIHSGAGFNGSNSQINAGNPSGLQLTSSFSISFWVKVNSTAPAGVYGLVNKTDDGSNRSYGIWYDNPSGAEGMTFLVSSDGTGSQFYVWNGRGSSADVGDTNWHHYVFTFDPNSGSPVITVYRDGSDVTAASGTTGGSSGWSGSTVFNSSSNVVIGDKTGGGWPLDGSMDEVGIWNRTLTSGEVSALYNAGAGKQYPF